MPTAEHNMEYLEGFPAIMGPSKEASGINEAFSITIPHCQFLGPEYAKEASASWCECRLCRKKSENSLDDSDFCVKNSDLGPSYVPSESSTIRMSVCEKGYAGLSYYKEVNSAEDTMHQKLHALNGDQSAQLKKKEYDDLPQRPYFMVPNDSSANNSKLMLIPLNSDILDKHTPVPGNGDVTRCEFPQNKDFRELEPFFVPRYENRSEYNNEYNEYNASSETYMQHVEPASAITIPEGSECYDTNECSYPLPKIAEPQYHTQFENQIAPKIMDDKSSFASNMFSDIPVVPQTIPQGVIYSQGCPYNQVLRYQDLKGREIDSKVWYYHRKRLRMESEDSASSNSAATGARARALSTDSLCVKPSTRSDIKYCDLNMSRGMYRLYPCASQQCGIYDQCSTPPNSAPIYGKRYVSQPEKPVQPEISSHSSAPVKMQDPEPQGYDLRRYSSDVPQRYPPDAPQRYPPDAPQRYSSDAPQRYSSDAAQSYPQNVLYCMEKRPYPVMRAAKNLKASPRPQPPEIDIQDSNTKIDKCPQQQHFIQSKCSKLEAKTSQYQIHNDSFCCSHPGCNKTFPKLYNLKSHIICHSDSKPHKCSICEKAFARKHDLQRHLRTIHSSERPFQCDICLVSFTGADALRRHKVMEHSAQATA